MKSITIRNESDKTVEILDSSGSQVLYNILPGRYITTSTLEGIKIPLNRMKIVNGVIKIKGD